MERGLTRRGHFTGCWHSARQFGRSYDTTRKVQRVHDEAGKAFEDAMPGAAVNSARAKAWTYGARSVSVTSRSSRATEWSSNP